MHESRRELSSNRLASIATESEAVDGGTATQGGDGPRPGDIVAELEPATYPALVSALKGENGRAIERELRSLLRSTYRSRAPRRGCDVAARLILPSDESIPVRVSDISRTGVQVEVPQRSKEEVMCAVDVSLMLQARSPEGADLIYVGATLVRVAGETRAGVRLAFQFRDTDPFDAHIDDITDLLSF